MHIIPGSISALCTGCNIGILGRIQTPETSSSVCYLAALPTGSSQQQPSYSPALNQRLALPNYLIAGGKSGIAKYAPDAALNGKVDRYSS